MAGQQRPRWHHGSFRRIIGSVLTGVAFVDHVLRRSLIEALKARGWSYHAAERAAEFVAGLPREGDGEWKVWPSVDAKGPDLYRVARRVNAVTVYDSPVEGRARDVSDALNEIERHGPDAAGSP